MDVPVVGMRGLRGFHPVFFSHHPLLLVIVLAVIVVLVLVARNQKH